MEIHTPQAFGATARGQRQRLHLTQAALAEAAGVSRAWLTEFERGKPTVELGLVLAVIAALGITVELRVGDPHAPSAEQETNELNTLLEDYSRRDDHA
ncbi:helix-turn-helix domain-containing protein [Streptomyces sp. SID13031]|uniref:helix-turn-helix domain-containing protein n=1 Tax=Streptomyces sp. SID13031 TaxID=2706046 RepID=UPI0013CA2E02|nr:helix-turn-helix transcriptional regulator [Streptomyces sp. SID13031]